MNTARPASPVQVSVVMAVHNAEPFLVEAMDSILMQDFTDFEFIVIDDASTDRTAILLKEYRQRDPRILVWRNEEQLGLTPSLNVGLKKARGAYIARQDGDDVSLPGRLAQQVAFLNAHPETVLVASAFEIIDSYGKVTGLLNRAVSSDVIPWLLLFYNHVSGHSTVMMRSKAVHAAGLYNERRTYAQDHDLWVRLARHGRIVILPEILLRWRRHEVSISTAHQEQQADYSLLVSEEIIAQLLGRRVERQEVVQLRAFWLQMDAFSGAATHLDRTLRSLVWCFAHAQPGLWRRWRSRHAACKATSEQWARWAFHEKNQRGWRIAVPYIGRAFYWAPVHGVTFLIKRALASLRRRCIDGWR